MSEYDELLEDELEEMAEMDALEEAEERISEALLGGVASLDLGFLDLNVIPSSLGELTALTELDLSGNFFELPDFLGNLTELRGQDVPRRTAVPQADYLSSDLQAPGTPEPEDVQKLVDLSSTA
ncbi:hypothetical protein ACWCQP_48385 [Streptomyces chartreusis]